MGTSKYGDAFKRGAVHQITVRGIRFGTFPGGGATARILCSSG